MRFLKVKTDDQLREKIFQGRGQHFMKNQKLLSERSN